MLCSTETEKDKAIKMLVKLARTILRALRLYVLSLRICCLIKLLFLWRALSGFFLSFEIPYRGSYKLEDCENRRKWVEQFTSTSLSNVGQWWDPRTSQGYSTENLTGNIENPIGLAKIPLGVAGPLLIKGEHVQEELIVCPFATTEGALVASASRGATAITRLLIVLLYKRK